MNQNRIPIMEALWHYRNQEPLSFHVPGHKNGQVQIPGLPEEFLKLLQYDLTEISGLDDFHSPEGCILEAQELLIELYKTRKSYFLVNGSTVGNLVMILAVCKEGDTVFVQRNCHKSILNALKLANVHPVFLEPDYDSRFQAAGGVHIETVRQAYKLYSSVRALIITYPNYYGMAPPLKEMIQMAKANGSLVLVDEAHGPHFVLDDPIPPSSLEWGADIVVQSAHKMLPAMTMGSYLHVHSKEISLEPLEFYLQALQSSSPSYPIMASLDAARAYVANMTKEDIAHTVRTRTAIAEHFQVKGVETLQPEDPLKLVLRKQGYSGYELQQQLEAAGIFTELADPSQVLCTLPLLQKADKNAFSQHAASKISALDLPFKTPNGLIDRAMQESSAKKISTLALSYREQDLFPRKWISLEGARGKVSAETVIPYPPGIPLVMTGEALTERQLDILQKLLENNVHIQGGRGLKENKIAVFSNSKRT
ncbi:aminotransferase class I/II-fold pyridoxal phosphate-dependent enzyme [Bacillus xiapuensis]|uniref:aminotransferase class I/II-fold pyridoxal phosphate-dependent enzyme n=1 Tax=Bacillus xiapuensis TaxID=2014075 RepID=UPI0012FE6E08|nr:aminotransferase class I/II-fold pyridoxal phosphate-dependent enzyme [Bacillus xiapuensis]